MHELKLRQLQYESDTWKRLLVFMLEQNIHQKNRLSEILKNGFSTAFLDDLEVFQNSFIADDALLNSLQQEIRELDTLLSREIYEDGKIQRKMERKIKKLRKEMKTTENKFNRLKSSFNNFLTEHI